MDELKPCPFCGKGNALDQYPCDFLDGSGANVVRCAWCHGAAPLGNWNRRAASGGDLASPEQRAEELLQAARSGWFDASDPVPHGAAIRAITAALANQQGVGADAVRYATYFRWLMRGKNLELAAALMDKDQYATLRRLCESLVPLDDAPTQPAGANQPAVGEPDEALLISMATCLNHGFGLLSWPRQQSMLRDMRKLWDEVMGRGYYTPERRDFYLGMRATQPAGDVGRPDA